MSYFRRIISMMLVLAMIITSIVVYDAKVVNAAAEKEIFRDNNCKVTFKVNSQWEDAFEGQFIIENIGKENLENWKFQVTFPHEITSLWDGKIASHKGDIYVIQHPDWNTKVPSGGKAVIGFNAKKGKNIVFPSECKLLMNRHNIDEEEFTITYKTTSDWGDAFNGEISIRNNTNKKIEGWELEFDFEKEITNFWTTKIKSKE